MKLDSLNQFKGYETYKKSHLCANLTAACAERTGIC